MLSATRSLGLRSQARSFPAFSAARYATPPPAQAGGYAAPTSDVGGPAPKPSAAPSPAAQLPVQHVQREMKISNPRTSKKERLIILGSGWGGFTLVSSAAPLPRSSLAALSRASGAGSKTPDRGRRPFVLGRPASMTTRPRALEEPRLWPRAAGPLTYSSEPFSARPIDRAAFGLTSSAVVGSWLAS
jgi:hypothetical protein